VNYKLIGFENQSIDQVNLKGIVTLLEYNSRLNNGLVDWTMKNKLD